MFQRVQMRLHSFSTVASRHRNTFLRVLKRLRRRVGCCFFLEPRTCETGPGSLPGAAPKKPRERRRATGRTGEASQRPGPRQPRPHLRGGGTFRRWTNQHLPALTWPPPAGSRGPRRSKGRGELSGAPARRRGTFFTLLSPAMRLPSGPPSSLLFLLLQVLHWLALAPAGTLPGGRAGSAHGGGVGRARGSVPWRQGSPGSPVRNPGMGVQGRARL